MLRRRLVPFSFSSSSSIACFNIGTPLAHQNQVVSKRLVFGSSSSSSNGFPSPPPPPPPGFESGHQHHHQQQYYPYPPPPPPPQQQQQYAYSSSPYQQRQQQSYNSSSGGDNNNTNQQESSSSSSSSSFTRSLLFRVLPMLLISGFSVAFVLDKLEEIIVSPCNKMADALSAGGVAIISCADTAIYHDAMFRESICLVTYLGPSGAEALIINKPIHDSEFEKHLRYYKFKNQKPFGIPITVEEEEEEQQKRKKQNEVKTATTAPQEGETEDASQQKQHFSPARTTRSPEVQSVIDDLNRQKQEELSSAGHSTTTSPSSASDVSREQKTELHSILDSVSSARGGGTTSDSCSGSDENTTSAISKEDSTTPTAIPSSTEQSTMEIVSKMNHESSSSSSSPVLRASSLPTPIHGIFQQELANNPVFCGGPMSVDENSVKLLHTNSNITDAVKVAPGLYLGGDKDQLRKAIQLGKTKREDVLVILGYSSWGPGQLYFEWRRGGWDFFVAGKDETNLRNVCRKMNLKTVPDLVSAEQQKTANGVPTWSTVSSSDDTRQRRHHLDKLALYQGMRQMYEDDFMKRAVKAFDEQKDELPSKRDRDDDDDEKTKTKQQLRQKMTDFVPSLFYTQYEHDVSSALWRDHLKCFDQPKATKLSGECVVTNLKKVSYFGNLSDNGNK